MYSRYFDPENLLTHEAPWWQRRRLKSKFFEGVKTSVTIVAAAWNFQRSLKYTEKMLWFHKI